jgi:hypothetical protein
VGSCTICLGPFINAVTLPCGHSFCRACIREWVESVATRVVTRSAAGVVVGCPLCRRDSAPF